jgi:DNA-binding response OmpR family regulator
MAVISVSEEQFQDAPPRVLVVEANPDVRAGLADTLSHFGFSVVTAGTRAEAVEHAFDADLIVLDLDLSDGDGLEVCSELARRAPVVVVSVRAEEVDRVIALELGADDYLSKPFGVRELVARCRTVLRRAGRPVGTRTVWVRDLQIDLHRHEVRQRGQVVDLTTKERELLLALARRAGGLVRRAELAEEVWGSHLWQYHRSLDVHMSSLRRKLGDSPRNPRYIQTVHGSGFRLLR